MFSQKWPFHWPTRHGQEIPSVLRAFPNLKNLQHNYVGNKKLLRPERPLQKSPDPLGPKSQKTSQKESFWGCATKSPKIPRKSQQMPKIGLFGVFFTFSGIFGDFSADPRKDSFWDFLRFRAQALQTLVNGRSGRKKIAHSPRSSMEKSSFPRGRKFLLRPFWLGRQRNAGARLLETRTGRVRARIRWAQGCESGARRLG